MINPSKSDHGKVSCGKKKVAGHQTVQNVIYAIKHLEGKIQMEYDEKYEMERMARHIPHICHRHHRHVCVKIFCQV